MREGEAAYLLQLIGLQLSARDFQELCLISIKFRSAGRRMVHTSQENGANDDAIAHHTQGLLSPPSEQALGSACQCPEACDGAPESTI